MKYLQILLFLFFLTIIACDPEPTGPEMNCNLNALYPIGYKSLNASKVFDIRNDPPKELRNGKIEYDLSHQWFILTFNKPAPPPYHRYFVDLIRFNEPS